MKDNLNKLIWLRNILNKNKVSITFFPFLICLINGTIYGFRIEGIGFQDSLSIITEFWLRMAATGATIITIIYFLFTKNKEKQRKALIIDNIKVFLMSIAVLIFYPGVLFISDMDPFIVWVTIIVWISILIFTTYVSVLERKYQR